MCVYATASNHTVDRGSGAVVAARAACVYACACRPRDFCPVEVAASAVKISWYQVSPIRIVDQSPLRLVVILAAIAVVC